MAKKKPSNTPPATALAKLIQEAAYGHSLHEVFRDFCEMAAISISNAIDLLHREEREKSYLRVVGRYKKETVGLFPQMLGELVKALEGEPRDVLGKLFHELDLQNEWAGQFFTSYDLCRMMAEMTLGDGIEKEVQEKGFITAAEPAAGAGAMVIAIAEALRAKGINYQQSLHVTATDVDIRCVHMSYVQLSLLGIPAVIVHGNSLSLEEWSRWYTPAHVVGLWSVRLRRRSEASVAPAAVPPPEPVFVPRPISLEEAMAERRQPKLVPQMRGEKKIGGKE